jgi:hypothetical protein
MTRTFPCFNMMWPDNSNILSCSSCDLRLTMRPCSQFSTLSGRIPVTSSTASAESCVVTPANNTACCSFCPDPCFSGRSTGVMIICSRPLVDYRGRSYDQKDYERFARALRNSSSGTYAIACHHLPDLG